MRHRKAAAAIVAGEPTVLPRRRGERLRTRRRRAASGAVPARPRHPAGRPGCRAWTANQPDAQPVRPAAPAKNTSQAKARAKARKASAQAGPSYADGASRRPAHVDRPAAAHVGKQGSVCGAGYRFARRRTRPQHSWLSTDAAERSYQLSTPGSGPGCCSSTRKRWNATYARLRRRRRWPRRLVARA